MKEIINVDQISEDAIRRLVDQFYAKVRADSELGPIFEHAIRGDWEPHLVKMRDFWSSVMLTSGRYKGTPVAVHEDSREVVLELGNLDQASVHSYGGFSSSRETLVELRLQRKPSPEELAEFDELSKKAGITPGGEWWLTESGTYAVHDPYAAAHHAAETEEGRRNQIMTSRSHPWHPV